MSFQFDVIVGNPPYQDGTGDKSTGLSGSKKNLYTQFIHLCVDLLKPNGYLAYVTPPGFLKSTKIGRKSDTLILIQENNLKYLNFDEAQHFPTVSLPCITSFILQKTTDYDGTVVVTNKDSNTIDMRCLDVVPLPCTHDVISKIQTLISPEQTLEFKRDDSLRVVNMCRSSKRSFVTIPQLAPGKLQCVVNDVAENTKGKPKPIHVMVCDSDEHAQKICDIMESDDMTYYNSHIRYGDANVYPGIINYFHAV